MPSQTPLELELKDTYPTDIILGWRHIRQICCGDIGLSADPSNTYLWAGLTVLAEGFAVAPAGVSWLPEGGFYPQGITDGRIRDLALQINLETATISVWVITREEDSDEPELRRCYLRIGDCWTQFHYQMLDADFWED